MVDYAIALRRMMWNFVLFQNTTAQQQQTTTKHLQQKQKTEAKKKKWQEKHLHCSIS